MTGQASRKKYASARAVSAPIKGLAAPTDKPTPRMIRNFIIQA